MGKKKKKDSGPRMLKFYMTIAGSLFMLGYCADFFSAKESYAVENDDRFLEVEACYEKEAEFVENIQKMTARPIVEQTIIAGSPDMEDFLSLKVGAYEHSSLYISERSEQAQQDKIIAYLLENIKHKRELVSWECGYETEPAPQPGKPATVKSHISWENAWRACNDSCFSDSHLFQLGKVSIFDTQEDIANSSHNRVRFRIPVVHTDLARLLYLHSNASRNGKLTHCSINGSQAITGEMFTAYQLALNVVQKIKQEHKKDYDIALALHDFLCNNVKYEMNMHSEANEALVVSTLLQQKATSYGYARTYMLLLTMAGIENYYVEGKYKTKKMTRPMIRAWNLVRLGGSWVYVDVAADDPAPDDKSFISHSYFGLSLQQLQKTSIPFLKQQSVDTTGSMYYFAKNKLQFRSEEKLLHAVIDNAWPKRIRTAEYCCLNPAMTVASINKALSMPSIQEKLTERNIMKIRLSCQPIDEHGVIRISVNLNDEIKD